ncbi:Lsr2 protein [Micromonospora eburnea]|uniref:Lsr2 protein n=2 Tax=Micromonospora eburnea TaxID=227316 RepID=A0A1C6V895_9ACTN|nr:Lsr2 protein [Micromonospora eburnea]
MGIRATTGPANPPDSPEPTTVPVEVNVDHLLSFALRSENGRTRALAEKIRTLAADLAQRCHTEYMARRQRLDAEIAALEQKLADARGRLHDLNHGAAAPVTPASPTTLARPAGAKSEVDAAAVRAWAAENGYQVQPMGRIPNGVVNAWREATIDATPAALPDDHAHRHQPGHRIREVGAGTGEIWPSSSAGGKRGRPSTYATA